MDKNDVAVALANIVNEGETPTKEFLALINRENLEQLYDWIDEYLVESSDDGEGDDDESDADAEDGDED